MTSPNPGANAPDDAIFIAWKKECFRSFQTAHILNCRLVLIWPFDSKSAAQTLLRYLASAAQTFALLLRQRPRKLAILNLPLPLALIAAAYARLFRAELILDCHSRPYTPGGPAIERALYPMLSRAAALNINHNEVDAATVRKWGGRNVLIELLPYVLPGQLRKPSGDLRESYVLCVCSFAPDEPIELIADAARAMPDIEIRMTGNYRKRSDVHVESFPANLRPTGFLSTADYYEMMAGAKAVLSLSRNGWIMHMASEEALLLGVPVVVSHSAAVQNVLGDAAIFVELSPPAIAAGVREAVARHDEFCERMKVAAVRQRSRVEATLNSVGSLT